jgi:enoyl-CoA hydratase
VLVLTLSRPEKLNALTSAGVEELLTALDASGRDERVRVVVLRGEGRSFCAGADVAQELAHADLGRANEFLVGIAEVLRRISLLPQPVIAAVQGHACGAGAEIALEADLRIAAEDAQVWLPDVGIGSTPASVYQLLRYVGRARTTAMVLLSQRLNAGDMLSLGMVSAVVPVEDLESAAFELALRLCERSATSLRFGKQAVRLADEASRDADLAANVAAMLVCYADGTQQEAAARFASKHQRSD